jgi:hypothetical protein
MSNLVSFGRQLLATDLNWQPCSTVKDASRKALAADRLGDASVRGASPLRSGPQPPDPVRGGLPRGPQPSQGPLVMVVRHTARQFAAGREHPAGAVSLAGLLADGVGGSFAGVFKLPEGYYFVEVHAGAVGSGRTGDRLFSLDERETVFRLIDKVANESHMAIYAPEDFGVKDAQPGELFALLSRIQKSRYLANALRPVLVRRSGVKLAVAAGLATLTLIGGVYLLVAPKQTGVAVQAEKATWKGEIAAGDGIMACSVAFYNRPELAGFMTENMSCNGREMRLTVREKTPVALNLFTLPAQCASYDVAKGSLILHCTVSDSAVLDDGPASFERRITKTEADHRLLALFRSLGYAVTLSSDQAIGSKAIMAEITGILPPLTTIAVFRQFPMMALENLAFVPDKNVWTVKVKLFVR